MQAVLKWRIKENDFTPYDTLVADDLFPWDPHPNAHPRELLASIGGHEAGADRTFWLCDILR